MRSLLQARLQAAQARQQPVSSMRAAPGSALSSELAKRLAGPHQRAAVLIGLRERAGQTAVLLTQRATHLARHAGQIAFPGGRIEPGDSGATAAALREAHEEIGLHPASVEVVGRLGDHLTGTGFAVTPIVGYIPADFAARPDPAEVAGVFEIPLEVVFGPQGLRECVHERYGTRLRGFELHYEGRHVWGATAAMLQTIRKILYETD